MKSCDGVRTCAMLLCAGTGSRTKLAYNKILHYIGKKTVLELTLEAFAQSDASDLLLVINPADEAAIKELSAPYENVHLTYGGKTRTESVRNGLKAASDCDVVAIHDGARPFLSVEMLKACYDALEGHDGVMPVLPMKDTVYLSRNGRQVDELLDRGCIYAGQAPELFLLKKYYQANLALLPERILEINGSTEPAVMAGMDIAMIPGDEKNFKITTEADLQRAAERL